MGMTGVAEKFPGDAQIGFSGVCGYALQAERVLLSIGHIANRRAAGDVSGSLAIELWGLSQPYAGGGFSGVALAGTGIGELLGQHYLTDCRYDLVFRQPPVGVWHLCLMLREWSGNGYVTRDFLNFAAPCQVTAAGWTQPRAVPSAALRSRVWEYRAGARGVAAGWPAKVVAEDTGQRLRSVNHASIEELAAIKGVSKKLARRVVAARPFGRWKTLRRIKGINKKRFKRIRAGFGL